MVYEWRYCIFLSMIVWLAARRLNSRSGETRMAGSAPKVSWGIYTTVSPSVGAEQGSVYYSQSLHRKLLEANRIEFFKAKKMRKIKNEIKTSRKKKETYE